METLKEFKRILLVHKIKVFVDHKNLEYAKSTTTSQRAIQWRVLLEKFGQEIKYIKGVQNTVADAIRFLDKGTTHAEPYEIRHTQICYDIRLFTCTK